MASLLLPVLEFSNQLFFRQKKRVQEEPRGQPMFAEAEETMTSRVICVFERRNSP